MMCPEDGCFPGLYCFNVVSKPWLSDGYTMILSSAWVSTLVILTWMCEVANCHESVLETLAFLGTCFTLDGDNIFSVSSSSVDVPAIKYGFLVGKASAEASWSWLDISSPISRCSEKVVSLL